MVTAIIGHSTFRATISSVPHLSFPSPSCSSSASCSICAIIYLHNSWFSWSILLVKWFGIVDLGLKISVFVFSPRSTKNLSLLVAFSFIHWKGPHHRSACIALKKCVSFYIISDSVAMDNTSFNPIKNLLVFDINPFQHTATDLKSDRRHVLKPT